MIWSDGILWYIIYDCHTCDIFRCLSSCAARWRLIACLSHVPCGALPSHQRVKFSKQKRAGVWCHATCWQGKRWNQNLQSRNWYGPFRLSQHIEVTSHDIQWCSTKCHAADAALQLSSGPRFDGEVRAAQTLDIHDAVDLIWSASESVAVNQSQLCEAIATNYNIPYTCYTLSSLHRNSHRRQSPLWCLVTSHSMSFPKAASAMAH